ncbi:MAG: hypothetical protein ACOYLS_12965 [Polymorphobacter sp.]
MLLRALCLPLLLAAAAAPAAETVTYALTPAEREAAIAAAAMRPEKPGAALLPSPERDAILGNSLYGEVARDKRIHGEFGMFIGTGGARGIFGATEVPLGEHGAAQFSFETSRLPGQNFQPYRQRR